MSEAELKELVTNFFLAGDLGVQTAEELAEEFLETLFRYRRMTSMLEEALILRITGGR
jgi:hypothetical protein